MGESLPYAWTLENVEKFKVEDLSPAWTECDDCRPDYYNGACCVFVMKMFPLLASQSGVGTIPSETVLYQHHNRPIYCLPHDSTKTSDEDDLDSRRDELVERSKGIQSGVWNRI